MLENFTWLHLRPQYRGFLFSASTILGIRIWGNEIVGCESQSIKSINSQCTLDKTSHEATSA